MHRNVYILALTQVFANSAPPVVTMVSGIIGTVLAPNPSLATLPAAMMLTGLGLTSVPAALIMSKIGRKAGFISAFIIATCAIFTVAYAVWIQHFILLCVSLFFIGGNMAFVSQFRFAAAESVDSARTGKAISIILLSGIVAAYMGPEVGKQAKSLISDIPYVGSFLSLGALYIIGVIVLSFYKNTEQSQLTDGKVGRPLATILRQPGVILSITAGTVSYAVMITIMMATPIQMHIVDGYSMSFVTAIIQSHMLGMYVPSLFTGWLLSRFGEVKLMMAGIVCLITSIAANISGNHIANYSIGLILLGVGWNFLFVAGTTLLTEQYRFSERFKVQAANDFTIYSIMAVGSLSAGALIHYLGWRQLNLLMVPLIILMIIVLIAYLRTLAKKSDQDPIPDFELKGN